MTAARATLGELFRAALSGVKVKLDFDDDAPRPTVFGAGWIPLRW
jgi:hypothetical protein